MFITKLLKFSKFRQMVEDFNSQSEYFFLSQGKLGFIIDLKRFHWNVNFLKRVHILGCTEKRTVEKIKIDRVSKEYTIEYIKNQ